MFVPPQLTKLNPTTITTPSTTLGGGILKITCSPYLSIQHRDAAVLNTARKNADSLFEVVVPVGGKVEVNIEAEGVGCLLGGTERGPNEFEMEERVKEEVIQTLDRVS